MDEKVIYTFIDESGNLNSKYEDCMLVLSALITNNPLSLARAMKTAEKKVRRVNKKSSNELKAAYQSSAARKKVLSELAKSDISIYSIIFDLSSINNKPFSYDEIYRVGMSILCSKVYSNYRAKRYILDKRYTKATLRNQLSQSIIDLIQKNSQDIVQIEISHCDSIEYAELRAVDFVAYETYQKYKNKSEIFEFISCLEHKELIFKNISWEKIKKESLTP